jgi:hypothetical protein
MVLGMGRETREVDAGAGAVGWRHRVQEAAGVGLGWALPGHGVVFGARWHFESRCGEGMGL